MLSKAICAIASINYKYWPHLMAVLLLKTYLQLQN